MFNGGFIPLSFRMDEERYYQIDGKSAPLVRELFQRYASGESMADMNPENFHHPIGVDFVRLDTVDYLKGHMFGYFPINYQNAQVYDAICKSLPENVRSIYDDIQDYFTYLECAGPKPANYAGYIIANHILPWVEPGYREDRCQTLAFTLETKKNMGILPL